MKTLIQGKSGKRIVKINRRSSIREKCKNCSEWSPTAVTNCEHTDCDLWAFKAGRGKQDAKSRSKAIRQYCLWCTKGQRREVRLCPSVDCSLYPYRKSGVDKSQDIKSLSEKRHIEPFSGDKNKSEYLSMGDNGKA